MNDGDSRPLTLLVNPDWRRLPQPGRFRVGVPYFPLELMYIEGALARLGLPAVMADMWAGTISEARLAELLPRADYIVFTTAPTYIFWRDGICDVEFPKAELARLRERAPRARIIAIGPQGTALPETMADAEIDYLVRGEPDLAAAELIAALARGDAAAAEGIAGVCARRGGELRPELHIDPRTAAVADLDELPLLSFESIAPGRYGQPSYEGSRGCPYACTFCFRAGFREKLRTKSPERIREELARIARGGYKFLAIIDEIFGMNPRWLDAFCEIIESFGLKFGLQTRTECLDRDRIARLARAGCIGLEIGLESADPEVSRAIGKRTDYAHLAANVRAACELGIEQVRLFCIFGSPKETLTSIRRTEEYLLQFVELPAVQADVYPMLPLPGTGVWQLALERGLPMRDWSDVKRHEGIVDNAFRQPREVEAACARFNRKWEYYRLRRLLKQSLSGRMILFRMWLTVKFPPLMGLRRKLRARLLGQGEPDYRVG